MFPVAENDHVDHILRTSTVPAKISEATENAARATAVALAERLKLVGLLAVEMFVTTEGDILVNEVAPRPHNSGHWTQDGCVTSQFEQLVRAVTGLPLGPVDVLFPTVMQNLIGDEAGQWLDMAAEPQAKLHLYGKAEARPGRKMGHVNRLKIPDRKFSVIQEIPDCRAHSPDPFTALAHWARPGLWLVGKAAPPGRDRATGCPCHLQRQAVPRQFSEQFLEMSGVLNTCTSRRDH